MLTPGSPPHRPVRGGVLGQGLRGPALPSLHPAGPGHTQAESQQEKEQQQHQGNDSFNIYRY